jgi:hypothetical protein
MDIMKIQLLFRALIYVLHALQRVLPVIKEVVMIALPAL